MSRRRWLVTTSVAETVSFAALLVAMVVGSDVGVSLLGALHGGLFLAYAWLVVDGRSAFGWRWPRVALLILTGPVGPIIALELLRRQAVAPPATAGGASADAGSP